jgi:hypothetical protein
MEPWRQTVQTYSWVTEQEEERTSTRLTSNVWNPALPILSHSHILLTPRLSAPPDSEVEQQQQQPRREKPRERIQQPESRRAAAARQRQQRQREEEERERLERVRLWEEENERQIQRARFRRADSAVVLNAWNAYENRWATIMSMAASDPLDCSLTFRTIPWPLLTPPSSPSIIAPQAIVLFLFSPLHSLGQSRKERIRRALLRWHPDKLARVRARVKLGPDQEWVEEGLGAVVRCLNELMSREGKLVG